MIQEITPNIQVYYSCQVCQRVVQATKDYIIFVNLLPICSKECLELLIYKNHKKDSLSQKMTRFSYLHPYTILFCDIKLTPNTMKRLDYDNALALSKWLLSSIKEEFIIIK